MDKSLHMLICYVILRRWSGFVTPNEAVLMDYTECALEE